MSDSSPVPTSGEGERLRRWRLVLGEPASPAMPGASLRAEDAGIDEALSSLYEADRSAGLGASSPRVARWLGDIRTYFPASVVQVLQRDAMDRLGAAKMLQQPEVLAAVEADVHLVAQLVALSSVMPEKTRATARTVVRKVARELERRLGGRLASAVKGSLSRATRTRRPRAADIDWDRTIRANLANWDAERRTIVAERLVGRGRRTSGMRDVVLCVDQSGSMAASVVYASIFAAVMATVRAVRTQMIVFDTAVADLTAELRDPVDLLFGVQLGGGTDIGTALSYCRTRVPRSSKTVLVLITDLYEGGDPARMLKEAAALVASGVQVVCLLALADDGAPAFDRANAARLTALGIPCFACTPDAFPDLMAAALQRRDLSAWAASRGIVTSRSQ